MFEINGVPEWLLFDSTTGIFQGVPSESDIENLNITLITHSNSEEIIKTTFSIEVIIYIQLKFLNVCNLKCLCMLCLIYIKNMLNR